MNHNPTSYGGNQDGQPPQTYQETVYASNQLGSNPNNYPNYPPNPYGAPPPSSPGAAPIDPYGVPPTVAANPASNPYGAPPPANPYPYPNPAPNPYGAPPPSNPYINNAPPPNPYSYPANGAPPAYPTPPPPAPRPSGNKTLLIVLAVLVVLSGLVALIGVSARNSQIATDNAHATATVNAGNKATATAQVNATATAAASTYPFSSKLTLSDPLKDNSKGVGWYEDKGCKFASDGYHIMETTANVYYTCPSKNTNYSNFTYQVSMNIIQGNLAGISFRGNENQYKYYTFVFRKSDSTYWLLLYTAKGVEPQTLDKNSTSYFNGTGTNQLGVVARGSKITLYVNGHQLTSTTDSTLTSGQIGTVVYNGESQGSTVEAVFSDLKLWQL